MDLIGQLYGFIFAFGIGFLLGVEREKSQKRSDDSTVTGIRTFTLLSLAGALCALLVQSGYGILMGFVALGLVLLVSMGYYLSGTKTKDIGATTEIAQIIGFSLGFLVYHPETRNISVILAVITTILLALKDWLHGFVKNIREYELIDTLKFAVIAFIILPLLPNEAIDPWDVINPHELWLLVVLISGISYVGYLLTKAFGVDKGLGLTGLLGGLTSSTAVTTAMAQKSKKKKGIKRPTAFAAILASNVMFPRIALEVFVVNPALFPKLAIPLTSMLLAGMVSAFLIWGKNGQSKSEIQLESPFAIKPALKFGLFFLVVLLLQHFAKEYMGESGLYGVSIISGLADVDAITLSTARMNEKNNIHSNVAVNAIMLAAISNTIMKFVYAYVMGERGFAKLVGYATLAMIVAGGIAIMAF